jgi:hypothetical protein
MDDFDLNLLLDASTRMESIDYDIGDLCWPFDHRIV